MFRTITTAVVAMVIVCGSVVAPDVRAQRERRPPYKRPKLRESEGRTTEEGQRSRLDDLRKAVKERVEERSSEPQGRTNRLDDLRRAAKERIEERSSEPQGRTTRLDDFREAVKKQLAERGIEPQGEATTRRLDSRRAASQIGADGLLELKKHGFVLQGHEVAVPEVEGSRHVVIPGGSIDFSERLGLFKPILPDDNVGGRVKIESYRFRYVVLIKITNQRTGKVTWIVRRRGSLFGSVLAVISRDAQDLDNQLDGIPGGGPWKTFLQLDELADFHIKPADVPTEEAVPTEEDVPMETQTQLADILKRFKQVRNNPKYSKITNLPEFQSTYENLQTLTGSFGASPKPSEPPAAKPTDGRLNLKPGIKVEAKPGIKVEAKP